MPTLRDAYPESWTPSERLHADRVAGFVDARVQEARQLRRATGSSRPHPLVMTAPPGALDVLRRLYPSQPVSEETRVLFVRRVRVVVHSGWARQGPSDSYELSWGSRRWRLRVPPPGLTEAEEETYLRLRADGVRPVKALDLTRLLSSSSASAPVAG